MGMVNQANGVVEQRLLPGKQLPKPADQKKFNITNSIVDFKKTVGGVPF